MRNVDIGPFVHPDGSVGSLTGRLREVHMGDVGYLLLSSILPTHIFLAAALEGSIFALLIGTISMVACHLLYERTRWIIPPRLRAAFHRSKAGGEDVEP